MLPLITLEEHYISSAALAAQQANGAPDPFSGFPEQISRKLKSLDDERIQDMDDGNISLQILSHGPMNHASTELCQQINDELAAAISQNPSRLRGFATLPMGSPSAAAQELERCIEKLGFVGALIDNHLDGKFYDDEKFWNVFEKASALDVPIYIHPNFTSEKDMHKYKGNYADDIAVGLANWGLGWHFDTGLHFLRLYAAGLFDRFPTLKIVLGHMGELLPFNLERIFKIARRWGRERGLESVWEENLWVTTSGMFSLAPLACLVQTKGKDKIMFSVDYPFSGNDVGREFVERVGESGIFGGLESREMRGFAYENAERLLKFKLVDGSGS
ncbi:hypothetical protein MFRU_012g01300 [Monilinia fructicola]|uniref:Amidohydrolase-related domain-containing protein n=1 Tax=Monilinia fructicola TaxID=38448 RepID=A0A5M9JGQ8_MONFR|nr:hypothetical protein EYC84_007601 [Monilinia fructicola]KAG4030394.1 hypothetical protein MFRU_012g01300 [Monilinia fructicola]